MICFSKGCFSWCVWITGSETRQSPFVSQTAFFPHDWKTQVSRNLLLLRTKRCYLSDWSRRKIHFLHPYSLRRRFPSMLIFLPENCNTASALLKEGSCSGTLLIRIPYLSFPFLFSFLIAPFIQFFGFPHFKNPDMLPLPRSYRIWDTLVPCIAIFYRKMDLEYRTVSAN